MWIVFGVRGVLLLSLEGPLWALAGGMSRAEMGALEPEFLGLPDLQLESSWPPVQLCGGGGLSGGVCLSLCPFVSHCLIWVFLSPQLSKWVRPLPVLQTGF